MRKKAKGGIEWSKYSVEALLNPKEIQFSWVSLVVLLISVGMKYWMYLFYTDISKRIDSTTLKASAIDSISDVMVTSIVIIAFILSNFSKLPVDAIGGIIVSLFILKSGYELILEMVRELVGESVDEEVLKGIYELFDEREEIVDTHDLNFHSYGPNNRYATIDAVVRNDMTVEEVHRIFTEIEHTILDQFQIMMTIHMDLHEEETKEEKKLIKILQKCKINNPHILSTHDEEIIDQEDKRNIIAHVVVDGNVVKTNEDELEEISMIENMLKKEFGNCEYHIVIDRDYNKV